jgi:hypothetical protein
MKYANIAPIVLGLLLCLGMITHYAIANESKSFEIRSIPSSFDYQSYEPNEDQRKEYELSQRRDEIVNNEVALSAGIITVLLILLTAPIYILNLILVRLKSVLVFNVISLFLSIFFIGWAMLMMSDPNKIGFDEIGLAFIAFSVYIIVSGVIGIVQASKYTKQNKIQFGNDEIIDDLHLSN